MGSPLLSDLPTHSLLWVGPRPVPVPAPRPDGRVSTCQGCRPGLGPRHRTRWGHRTVVRRLARLGVGGTSQSPGNGRQAGADVSSDVGSSPSKPCRSYTSVVVPEPAGTRVSFPTSSHRGNPRVRRVPQDDSRETKKCVSSESRSTVALGFRWGRPGVVLVDPDTEPDWVSGTTSSSVFRPGRHADPLRHYGSLLRCNEGQGTSVKGPSPPPPPRLPPTLQSGR